MQEVQRQQGSRSNYARMMRGDNYNDLLGEPETAFIEQRDSFYIASVSEKNWPYIQHRGGPAGFMKVLDKQTIGFADYSGNRQYVSTGNFINNDRVALFFMDYPNRRRLKLLGHVRIISTQESKILSRLENDDYQTKVERGFLIHVDAFDWNCPQHITPRYTDSQVEALIAPLVKENQLLKACYANFIY